MLVGVLVCLAAFAWSCASPRSLRLFLERVYPPVMVLALLYSYLPGSAVFLPLNLLVGYAIPVAGTYLFIFAWFFLVAAQDMENGLLSILLAWVLTVLLRAFFEFFDGGAAKLAISALLVCLMWGLLLFQSKRVDESLPMVANKPSENRASYVHALRSIWRFRTIRYSINHLFRVMFPFLVVVLCALPFIGMDSLVVTAAAIYITYSFMGLSLQVLCLQTAHDYGVNPVFCISFQIGVSLCTQGLGYLLGNAVNIAVLSSIPPLASIALISVAMLALVMYLTRGLSISQEEEGRDIEFLSLSRKAHRTGEGDDGETAVPWDDDVKYADRLSIRCDLIGKKYYLSQREIEVMHLFARGYTMAAIAQELFISENTVKTHMRRLYAKVGVHKKQQLLSMLNNYVE